MEWKFNGNAPQLQSACTGYTEDTFIQFCFWGIQTMKKNNDVAYVHISGKVRMETKYF